MLKGLLGSEHGNEMINLKILNKSLLKGFLGSEIGNGTINLKSLKMMIYVF